MNSFVRTLSRLILPLLALTCFTGGATAAEIVVGDGCTLADAIHSANDDISVGGCTAGSGADVIILTGDVDLTSALPDVDNGSVITLRGNGFRVRRLSSASAFRVFYVPVNGDLTIDNTIVAGGAADSGAGILSRGDLAITNSTITQNVTSGIFGGGIYSDGTLTLDHSTVSDNSAVFGGGLSNFGEATISYSRFDGNYAASRGGAIHHDGTLMLLHSALTNNLVQGDGGAPGHSAGGGLFAYFGSTTLLNTTISGNTIIDGNGGGVMAYYGSVTLENTTIADNSAPSGSAIFEYYSYPTLINAVVEGSCSGTIINGGNNIGCGFGGPTGLDGTLADNGGPTPTHALLDGSPAIDHAGPCNHPDQRGFGRSGDCDSGAYEYEGVRPAIGGTAGGLDTFRAKCANRATAQQVTVDLGGATSWDCESAGLAADLGDVLEQSIIGRASSDGDPIGGSVTGMRLSSVLCTNVTTDQQVAIVPAGLAVDWDCSTAGLTHLEGDRIRMSARGDSD